MFRSDSYSTSCLPIIPIISYTIPFTSPNIYRSKLKTLIVFFNFITRRNPSQLCLLFIHPKVMLVFQDFQEEQIIIIQSQMGISIGLGVCYRKSKA